jgi:cell division protein FtsW (lipid II flippase)
MRWLERWQQRGEDIARGADADLFRANSRRYLWAAILLGLALLLRYIGTKFRLSHELNLVFAILVAVLLVSSLVLARYARMERSWLRKPDPEEPPRIFKD